MKNDKKRRYGGIQLSWEMWQEPYKLTIPVILYGSFEITKHSLSEKIPQKRHLNLATEVRKGFSPGVFNRLCVTRRKSNRTEIKNLKSKEWADTIFLKVALKATFVNSDSLREA